MERIGTGLRRLLLSLASNVSLFVFAAFLHDSLLIGSPFALYREQIGLYYDYLIVPWGMALCLLRLQRRCADAETERRWDVPILFVLLVWLVAPFALRFGATRANVSSWLRHTLVFFAIYASVAESDEARRGQLLDAACAVFTLYALALGTALLYCCVGVRAYAVDWGDYGFGVCDGMYLCAGVHYNTLGMAAICLLMLSLAACVRPALRKMLPLSMIAAAEMALVIVLTQSRTARYAMLIALALGAYGHIASTGRCRRAIARHMIGVLAAAVVAVGGYQLAAAFNDAVIDHYNQVNQLRASAQDADGFVWTALASEETSGEAAAEPEPLLQARAAVDATFSDRTNIWKNIFNFWKHNPQRLLIGNGAGRSEALIVQGTIHEERGYVPMHNAYLQFIADYGLIGFALLGAFLLCMIRPLLRVFFAPKEKRRPGDLALCMLVLAALATGMMESNPLEAFSPINMMLFFALALLAGRGRDMRALVKEDETVL